MSTEHSIPPVADAQPPVPQRREKRGWGGWAAGAALAAFALFFIANCRVALDPRVANPNVQGWDGAVLSFVQYLYELAK